jgi:hypothetical protein
MGDFIVVNVAIRVTQLNFCVCSLHLVVGQGTQTDSRISSVLREHKKWCWFLFLFFFSFLKWGFYGCGTDEFETIFIGSRRRNVVFNEGRKIFTSRSIFRTLRSVEA